MVIDLVRVSVASSHLYWRLSCNNGVYPLRRTNNIDTAGSINANASVIIGTAAVLELLVLSRNFSSLNLSSPVLAMKIPRHSRAHTKEAIYILELMTPERQTVRGNSWLIALKIYRSYRYSDPFQIAILYCTYMRTSGMHLKLHQLIVPLWPLRRQYHGNCDRLTNERNNS